MEEVNFLFGVFCLIAKVVSFDRGSLGSAMGQNWGGCFFITFSLDSYLKPTILMARPVLFDRGRLDRPWASPWAGASSLLFY